MLTAVVDQIARTGNRHVGGGDDVLRDDGQLALALLDGEVAGLETVLPGVGDGIGNLALGHRHDPADRLQVIDLATEQGLGALDRHRVIGLVRAVVHELARIGRKLHGSGRDLVLPGNGASVTADARNGHLDGARHVGEVIGAVGHRIIAALDERVAVLAGDHGNPLMLARVVNGVARSVDLHPGIRARDRVVRVDGLRAHRQRAVPIGDVVVLHLRAAVAGRCGEGVLAGTHRGLEAEEVVAELLAGSKRTIFHADLMLGERGAVVDLGGVAGDKRHRTLGHDERGLAGRHVAELVGDVLAGGVRDDIGINFCRGVPGVGDGAFGLGRKGEARGHADHVDPGAFEGRAIVDLGAALRNHHDAGHALGDLERAEVLLDRVVLSLRVVVPHQLAAVFAHADGGLAAGGLKGCGLAVHEAGRLALGRQRIAVIGLGSARGGHRQLRRLDLDGAVDELDVQLGGDVLALGVPDDEHVGRGSNLAVGDVRRRRAGRGGLERVALGQGADRHGGAMGRAVVGERAARGGHDNLVGGLGDGQLADGFGDRVVRLLGGGACRRPVDGVGVVARVHLGLGAGGLEGRGLAVDEAGDGAGGGQRLAVVDPGGTRRAHRQRRGRDAVRHVDAAGIVALAGHGHGHAARIGRVLGVRQLVVDAFSQLLFAVLHDRLLLLALTVVGNVGQAADGHLGDALRRDGQRAVVLRSDIVIAFLGGIPRDARHRVGGRADLGLGTLGLSGRVLAADKAFDRRARSQGFAVIDLGSAAGIHGQRSFRDLVRLHARARVAARAGDRHVDDLHVHEVVGVVGHRVIATLDELVAVLVGDLGSPLVLRAVVDMVARLVDRDALIGIRVLRIGCDGLSRHRKSADVLADDVVVVLRTGLELVGDRVLGGANLGLRARRVHLAVTGKVGPDEARVRTVRSHVDPVLRKGRTVVHLGRAGRRQLDVALLDGKRLLCILIAAVVRGGSANLDGQGAGIDRRDRGSVAAPLGIGATLDAILKVHVGSRDGSRSRCGARFMRGCIIYIGSVVRRDGDAIFGRKRRDAQLALVLGDVVVVRVEASVRVVCDRVGDLALGNGGHGTRSANVGNLARHKAGVSLLLPAGNLGLDKRGAIVGLRAALGLQLNGALGDLVRALDLAGIVVDAFDGHCNLAGGVGALGGAVFDGVVLAGFKRALPILDHGRPRLILAVVDDIRRRIDGHRILRILRIRNDRLRRDSQRAVRYGERDLREVFAGVGELLGSKVHLVGADIRALGNGRSAEGEVAFPVQLVGSLDEVITFNGLLQAVVLDALVMAGDGRNHLGVARGHHELTEFSLHPVVVGVRTFIEVVFEGVVAIAGIGLGTGDLDGHALAVDEAGPLALRFNRHGIVGKRFTIIFLAIALRSQLDRAAGNGDPFPVFRVLISSVVRARRAQHHQLSAEMGQRDTRRIVRPLFTVSAVLHLERIAELVGSFCDIRGKRRAVVDLLHIVYIPDDLASIEIAARNLKRAIDDHKLHVGEVAASIGELPGSQVHVIGAGIRALCSGLTLELNVGFAVAIITRGEGVTGHTLLGAAVRQRCAVARDGDGDLVGNGADVQVAGRRLGHDIVIIGANLADGAIRERIRVIPGVRALAALERHAVEAGAHALGEVRRVAIDALLGTVIGFGIGIRLQRNVLAVVELHHILRLVSAKLEVLNVIADRRVTGNHLGRKPSDLVAHMARTLLA